MWVRQQHISQNSPNSMMNAGTHGTQIPSILSKRGIVGRGKTVKDRPPVQVVEVGSLLPTSHSKVVATAHPRYSHVPRVHGWEGGTVGDYIQRSLERGVWSPGTLLWWKQVRQNWKTKLVKLFWYRFSFPGNKFKSKRRLWLKWK